MRLLLHVALLTLLTASTCGFLQAQKASTSVPVTSLCATLEQQGRALIEQRKFEEAIPALRTSLSVCPHDGATALELADAQMLAEHFADALSTLKGVLAVNPNNVAALVAKGKVLYLEDRDADAEAAFRAASLAEPADAEPHYLMGRVEFEDSHLKAAAEEFERAITLDPSDYKAYDALALCDGNLGDVHGAVQAYMRGLALVATAHPHYDVIYADFAEFLLKYGENAKAFTLASDGASRNPGNARDYFLAGKALAREGQTARSVLWLKRAVKLDPAYPAPHYLLARIYYKRGDNARAQRESRVFAKLLAAAPQVRR